MESFALDHLKVLEGDLSKLYEPGGRYIAAVYSEDDYGDPIMDSHWAKLGDSVTLRYVEELEYYNPNTGEIYGSWDDIPNPDTDVWASRAAKWWDVDYTVVALVSVPSPLDYRYYGSDEFVLNDQTFIQDTQTDTIMYYAFDTTEDTNDQMEAFLSDYTNNVNPQFDYESKATYLAEFESFRSMFLLLGGALSFIVGLVGVLNFFNAILTGIITRKREFAMLQSVGMTGPVLCFGGRFAVAVSSTRFRSVDENYHEQYVLVLHISFYDNAYPAAVASICTVGGTGSIDHLSICSKGHDC